MGSTNVARLVYTGGAARGKRVQALGGAKNHLVVIPDSDIDRRSPLLYAVQKIHAALAKRRTPGAEFMMPTLA